jgi:hypothetical protein
MNDYGTGSSGDAIEPLLALNEDYKAIFHILGRALFQL